MISLPCPPPLTLPVTTIFPRHCHTLCTDLLFLCTVKVIHPKKETL